MNPVGITLVVPCHDEADNVPRLVAEVDAVRGQALPGLQLVLVDDGSGDGTWEAMGAALAAHPDLPGLRLRLSGRNGQSAALFAGLREVHTPLAATIDGDLQNDPADLPSLVDALEAESADAACGYRAKRRDRWSKRVASRWANRLRRRVTGDNVRDTGCSLKVFRSACIGDLPPYRGMHRFMPAWFGLHGRKVIERPVGHRPREQGRSKYTNLGRLPETLADLRGFAWVRRRYRRARVAERGSNSEGIR